MKNIVSIIFLLILLSISSFVFAEIRGSGFPSGLPNGGNSSGGGGGSSTPGGSSPQLQYNNAGSFGGVSGSGVNSNGNLGLGSINPEYKLRVNGNAGIGTTNPLTITYNPVTPFPYTHTTGNDSIDIKTTGANQDINLFPSGNGQVNIFSGNGIGIKPSGLAAGPDFGPDMGGINYRVPTESMPNNFFLFRGGQYVFENDIAAWQLILTPSGNCFGCLNDSVLIPQSKLEVSGGQSIGADYARALAAPTNGLIVEGNVGIGTFVGTSAPLLVNGAAKLTGMTGSGIGGFYMINNTTTATQIFSMTRQDFVTPSDISMSAYGGIALTGGRTTNNPSVTTYGFYLDQTNNVGVGTINPTGKFQVKANGVGSSSGYSLMSSNSANKIAAIQDAGAGDRGFIGLSTGGTNKITLDTAGSTFLNGGNVGIGTTLPVGLLNVAAASDIGWTVKTGANTACNTTCPNTSGCVFGEDTSVVGTIVACTDATADVCVCAGP